MNKKRTLIILIIFLLAPFVDVILSNQMSFFPLSNAQEAQPLSIRGKYTVFLNNVTGGVPFGGEIAFGRGGRYGHYLYARGSSLSLKKIMPDGRTETFSILPEMRDDAIVVWSQPFYGIASSPLIRTFSFDPTGIFNNDLFFFRAGAMEEEILNRVERNLYVILVPGFLQPGKIVFDESGDFGNDFFFTTLGGDCLSGCPNDLYRGRFGPPYQFQVFARGGRDASDPTDDYKGLAFGPGGSFGNDLYVSGSGPEQHPEQRALGLFKMKPDGSIEEFTSDIPIADDLIFATNGPLGNYLYAASEPNIYRIDPEGAVEIFAEGFLRFSRLGSMAFDESGLYGGALFVTDSSGNLYRVVRADAPDLVISPETGAISENLALTVTVSDPDGLEDLLPESFRLIVNGRDVTAAAVEMARITPSPGAITLSLPAFPFPVPGFEAPTTVFSSIEDRSGNQGAAVSVYSLP